ncbi:MAG: sigma-70 family RNA polymerase sigma factor, partial [Eubacterium sp.]|nr:sigma-70 family RNA polymerase sigma factor [Eubacterium sp.]
INTLKDLKAFKSWFNMIVVNTAKNVSVKNNRNPYNFSQLENEDDDMDFEDNLENDDISFMPEEAFDNQELIAVMGKIMADINADQRICLQLFYYNGMKIKEIAEALDISESTVKTRLRLGKAKVEAKVEEYEKKGYKFHGIVFFPFFNASMGETVVPTLTFKTFILPFITEAAKGTAVAALGSAAAAKIIIGITATVVVAGGVIAAVFFSHNDTPPETTAPVHAVVETTTEPTTESIQIEETTNGNAEEQNTVSNTVAETTTQQTESTVTVPTTTPISVTEPVLATPEEVVQTPTVTNPTVPTETTKPEETTKSEESTKPEETTEPEEEPNASYDYELLDDGTIKISSYAGNETEVVIPTEIDGYTVSTIGKGAFWNGNLTKVEIPVGIKDIEENAFSNCDSLEEVVISDSVNHIANEPFSYCTSLSKIVIDENNNTYDSRENCNAIIETETNTLIAGCKNTTIPNGVEIIGSSAFFNCEELTEINIPNSVTTIKEYAFAYCEGLSDISIPNTVTTIEKYAFEACSSLTNIEIPESVSVIAEGLFKDCVVLKNITLSDGVESIEFSAFDGCETLESIYLPASITSLSNSWMFAGCNALETIVVDENNSVYDSRNNCNAIIETETNTLVAGCKNTVIPQSVTGIAAHSFAYCEALTEIEIPQNVSTIFDDAFRGCSSLEKITILNSDCFIGDTASTISDTAIIYGYANSTAQAYAKKYDRTFIPLD